MFEHNTRHPNTFPFLQLPNELQLSVLQNLDGRSILACRQASRVLASAIDNDARISYQLELELAGMVDGPPGNEGSLHERLDALRAWTAAWASGEYPLHEFSLGPSQRSNYFYQFYSPSRTAVDIACTDMQDGSLKVHRPPSSACGIRAKDYVYQGFGAQVDTQSIVGFHVDLAQDLFVWLNGHNPNNPLIQPTLHFCSLANGFGPHPDAARPTITPCFVGWLPVLRLQVLDDIVACNIHGGEIHEPRTDVLVVNWKTGVVVWHMHLPHDRITVTLLTQTQLCIMHSDNMPFYLYTFDPRASADSPVSALKDSVAVLRLPACNDRVLGKSLYGDIGLPPAYPDGTPHRFRHDPAHSLVTVAISLGYVQNVPGYDPEDSPMASEQYLLLIPIDTLLREYRLADDPYHAPLPTATVGSSGSEPNRIVPWERWGPSGTRMVCVQTSSEWIFASLPSALGAYAAVTSFHSERQGHVATVYKVHPLADAATSLPMAQADGSGVQPGQEIRRSRPKEDYIRGANTWANDIHTTFPCKVTTRRLPFPLILAVGHPYCVLLTHDGLVHIEVCTPVALLPACANSLRSSNVLHSVGSEQRAL